MAAFDTKKTSPRGVAIQVYSSLGASESCFFGVSCLQQQGFSSYLLAKSNSNSPYV